MTTHHAIMVTKDNTYIDGVVAEDISYCSGDGEILGEPTLTQREIASGTPYKDVTLTVTKDRIEGGELKGDIFSNTLYARLIGNSKYYQEAGKIWKWVIMECRYWHWYDKTDKTLKKMVDDFFSSGPIPIGTPTEIGTLTVMGTDYALALDVISKGPPQYKSIYVGMGTALQGYYPMGKGDGGESESVDPVKVYSGIQGNEYKFNLTFKRESRPALS